MTRNSYLDVQHVAADAFTVDLALNPKNRFKQTLNESIYSDHLPHATQTKSTYLTRNSPMAAQNSKPPKTSQHTETPQNTPESQSFETAISPSGFTTPEKFEILSAYLDDEVTEEERALVNHWLSSDPVIQEQYQKQLKLKAAIKSFLT